MLRKQQPPKYITKELVQKQIDFVGDNLAELDLSSKSHLGPTRIKIIQNIEGTNVDKICRLDLSGNVIEKIENLHALTGLKFLNLSGNRIKRIENLNPLSKSLVELDLSNNVIDRIPSSIAILVKLRTLHLSNNSLETLGDVEYLGKCKNLVELDLRWNPMDKLPHWRLFTLHHVRSLVILNNESVDEEERNVAIRRFSQLDKECLVEELNRCRQERDKLKIDVFSSESRISAYVSEVERLQNSLQISLEKSNYLEKKIAFLKSESRADESLFESLIVERKNLETEKQSKDLIKRLESLLQDKEAEILQVKEEANRVKFDKENPSHKKIEWEDQVSNSEVKDKDEKDDNEIAIIKDLEIKELKTCLDDKEVEINFIKNRVKTFIEALQKSLTEWYVTIMKEETCSFTQGTDVEFMLANFGAILRQYRDGHDNRIMRLEDRVIGLQKRFESELHQYVMQFEAAQEELETYREMLESKSSRMKLESSLLLSTSSGNNPLDKSNKKSDAMCQTDQSVMDDILNGKSGDNHVLIEVLQNRISELSSENKRLHERCGELEKKLIIAPGSDLGQVNATDPRYSFYMDTMKRMLHKRKEKLVALTESLAKAKDEKNLLDKEIAILKERKFELEHQLFSHPEYRGNTIVDNPDFVVVQEKESEQYVEQNWNHPEDSIRITNEREEERRGLEDLWEARYQELSEQVSALQASLHRDELDYPISVNNNHLPKVYEERRSSTGIRYYVEKKPENKIDLLKLEKDRPIEIEEDQKIARNESVINLYHQEFESANASREQDQRATNGRISSNEEDQLKFLREEGWQSTDGLFSIPKTINRDSDSMTDFMPRLVLEGTGISPSKPSSTLEDIPLSSESVIPFPGPDDNHQTIKITEKDPLAPTPFSSLNNLSGKKGVVVSGTKSLPKTNEISDYNGSTDRIKKLHQRLEKKCEYFELASKLKNEKIRAIKKELEMDKMQ